MKLEQLKRKVQNPPAAQNFARLNEPGDVEQTAKRIVAFATGIPSFNYMPGLTVCTDKVRLDIELETALKAVSNCGAPAGREANEDFVRAFFEHDDERGYSRAKFVNSYEGRYLISRDVEVPTRPSFTIYERGLQVPVIICGWKRFPLTDEQIRLWMTLLESGLFSYADYARSPAEVVIYREVELSDGTWARKPLTIARGDYALFSDRRMREIAAEYVRAQEMALPVAAAKWSERERKRDERDRARERDDQTQVSPGLFD